MPVILGSYARALRRTYQSRGGRPSWTGRAATASDQAACQALVWASLAAAWAVAAGSLTGVMVRALRRASMPASTSAVGRV